MTYGQDALTVTETKDFTPISLHSGVTYWECRSKIRNSPTPSTVQCFVEV